MPTSMAASSTALYVMGSDFKVYRVDTSSGTFSVAQSYSNWGSGWSSAPVFASNGSLWFAVGMMFGTNTIDRLSTSGKFTTIAIPLLPAQVYPNTNGIIAMDGTNSGTMWFLLGPSIGSIVVR